MIAQPVVDRNWLNVIEDSIALVRESLGALGDDRRSHTVTPKQLEQALDAIDDAEFSRSRRPSRNSTVGSRNSRLRAMRLATSRAR